MATTTPYESCTQTATRVRAALKAHFPGVKFSVRSSSYSGGASIRVRWTDGPRRAVVEPIVKQFAGATFDGMTDSKSYHTTMVDGQPLHFGADFVFCERDLTNEQEAFVAARAMIVAGCLLEGSAEHPRFGNQWVDDLARGMVYDRDADGSLEGSFRRIVLRDSEA